jgi:four helix bundle protein
MAIRNYSDLIAWQKAMTLAEETYEATKSLPREELYGLTSQMRKAAVSVPSNIAEGQGRRKDGQFLHFLSISHGSLRELETQIMLANRLHLLSDVSSRDLLAQCAEVGRLLNGLMNSIKENQPSNG